MIAADTFTPRGELHFVRFTKVPEQSEGGIWLPDDVRENYCEAEVLTSGLGQFYVLDEEERMFFDAKYRHIRSPMWAKPGHVILFQKHSFTPLAGQEEGLIRDSDIIAVNNLTPLNDWIRIKRVERNEYSGSIAIPDEWQTSEPMGIVENWGPGKLIKVGPLSGRRIPIYDILGLSCEFVLNGCMVRWGKNATVLEVSRDGEYRTFVRAQDLDCIVCED